MIYFLADRFRPNASGVEHAEVKRLKLFKQNQHDTKIVSTEFNLENYSNQKRLGLGDSDAINVFDWYQDAVNTKTTKQLAKAFCASSANLEFHSPSQIVVKSTPERVIDLYDSVDSLDQALNSQVQQIRYYDTSDNLVKIDGYDCRGFLSITSLYGQRGGVNTEFYYSPQHKIRLSCNYYYSDGARLVRIYKWSAENGQIHIFFSTKELVGFFLDRLNINAVNTIFISDFGVKTLSMLLEMKTRPKQSWVYFHNIISFHYSDPKIGNLDPVLSLAYENASRIDGIICGSIKERNELRQRLAPTLKIYAVPPVVLTVTKPILQNSRIDGRCISISRISSQKGLDKLISAFTQIKATVKDATLKIYGLVNEPKLKDQLINQINTLGLKDSVEFVNYVISLNRAYSEACVCLATSRDEGYNMSLVEASSYGVPIVSFDTPYGPSEIVQNEINGFLVPQGDVQSLANRAIDILKMGPTKWNQLSEGARNSSFRYSSDEMWNRWIETGMVGD